MLRMSEPTDRPRVLDLVVETGVSRLPVGYGGGGGGAPGEFHRPRLSLWVDQRSGAVLHFKLSEGGAEPIELALEALGELIVRLNGVPRQAQTRDPSLAVEMGEAVRHLGIEVVVRESLPMLDEAVASLGNLGALGGAGIRRAKGGQGVLAVAGMTLEHLIAFAEAAKAFHDAAPWQHLSDEDLIEIANPPGPKGTRFANVLGGGGQTFGLGFLATRKAHDAMRQGLGPPRGGLWTLLFGDIDSLEFEDGETYERHRLPVANPQAYAEFVRITPSNRSRGYPTPDQLAWAEGLLRALAATGEAELDAGRWSRDVRTIAGPMTFELSLPILLEQMAAAAQPRGVTASSKLPAERALDLCAQAEEARGRREIQLLRAALDLDPDCVEALLMLADRTPDADAAIPIFQRAVDAAARNLGPDAFERFAGHFWGARETRPYMTARQQLVGALLDASRDEEAADHLREMLRLNPGDNQGNRYVLAQCLLRLNRLDELESLLNRADYRDDASADWAFARALLAFRRHGDAPASRTALRQAQESNPFVVPLLLGGAQMPPMMPQAFSPGSEQEAILCVEQLAGEWYRTPGALEWLQTAGKTIRKAKSTGKKKGRGRT